VHFEEIQQQILDALIKQNTIWLAIKLGFPTNYFDKLVEKKNQGMCK
jgi:hypothetical protein